MERVFSPLDEELALLPGSLAPGLHERLVRLSTWIPSFEHSARELGYLTSTYVSEPTVRRLTEAAGQACCEVQTQQVERLERELPEPPEAVQVQQLSVDGAMVPLVRGEWAEVKTLAVGTVDSSGGQVHTHGLSYFSRLTDSEAFTRLSLVETHRRGTDAAQVVVAVSDGAEWCQGFVDVVRPDAVRVLDFAHAAEYISRAAQAVWGPGTARCCEWIERQRHELRHGDPDRVLESLRQLGEEAKGEAVEAVAASARYFEKRYEQIRYSEYELMGLPLGSGCVESACKLLVEARLKGPGMHWARKHVNPMLGLRTIAYNDRWEEAWPRIVARLRARQAEAARARRETRRKKAQPAVIEAAPAVEVVVPERPAPKPCASGRRKPAADHPWRRLRFGRASTHPKL